jgi:hypothetical protein
MSAVKILEKLAQNVHYNKLLDQILHKYNTLKNTESGKKFILSKCSNNEVRVIKLH